MGQMTRVRIFKLKCYSKKWANEEKNLPSSAFFSCTFVIHKKECSLEAENLCDALRELTYLI